MGDNVLGECATSECTTSDQAYRIWEHVHAPAMHCMGECKAQTTGESTCTENTHMLLVVLTPEVAIRYCGLHTLSEFCQLRKVSLNLMASLVQCDLKLSMILL
jgi:hypothetical protein